MSCCPPTPVTRARQCPPPPCQPVVSQGSSAGSLCFYQPPCPPPCAQPMCCMNQCCNMCPPNMYPPNIKPLCCYNPCCLPPGSVIMDASQIPGLPGCGH